MPSIENVQTTSILQLESYTKTVIDHLEMIINNIY